MRFSEAWLREWVDPAIGTAALADQLSMAGLEVDAVTPVASPFTGVVVGEVMQCEQHPNADKLQVCQVAVGAEAVTQIVCGASNVATGLKVPVALPGARLGADFKIRKTKLRGVPSLGMICSAAELGLAETSTGILPLAADAPVGEDFRAYWALDDVCIAVDLTPDRGDCLSVRGIAREVAALNQIALPATDSISVPEQQSARYAVEVLNATACPHYACRIVQNIDRQAQTPHWMQERLRRSGVHVISPVVDVTNYVLLEMGQPLHAFDLNCLQGTLQVRPAVAGESLVLLDGTEVQLQPDTLLIADQNGPLALAGIMGGAASGVGPNTEHVLLEAAFFSPLAMAGQARRYGLHTEASHRFERGVDPNLPHQALQRATALLCEIMGGQPGPIVEVTSTAKLPQPVPIMLRRARIAHLLGVTIADAEVVAILRRLNMQVIAVEEGWQVTPPSARFDITLEVDLIEELARLFGYANIPAKVGSAPLGVSVAPEALVDIASAKQALVARGFQEAITYSFISQEWSDLLVPQAQVMHLQNPVSQAMSVMRASLWPGLLHTVQHNLARQQNTVRLFEHGLVFQRVAEQVQQQPHIAGVICGQAAPEQWGQPNRAVDFYDLKGDLEHLLVTLVDQTTIRFQAEANPILHPGQSARLFQQAQPLGWIGMLHPHIQDKLDLPSMLMFELDVTALTPKAIPEFMPTSKFPAIRRDLAVIAAMDCPAQQILEVARQAAPTIVRDIQLFDLYTGTGIAAGQKSMALRLLLQAADSTLEDAQVEQACSTIMQALNDQLAVTLRD